MSRDKYMQIDTMHAKPKNNHGQEGYGYLHYQDMLWTSKNVFEKTHMKVSDNNKVLLEEVERLIKFTEVTTIGEKTTMVRAVLQNDFEIIKTSSCVDIANYSMVIGEEICMGQIKDEIFYLLGFLLQTAIKGFRL